MLSRVTTNIGCVYLTAGTQAAEKRHRNVFMGLVIVYVISRVVNPRRMRTGLMRMDGPPVSMPCPKSGRPAATRRLGLQNCLVLLVLVVLVVLRLISR